ncbi:MAG: STAS domain-containing protein [Acidithiobacillus sp.]
MRMDIQQEQNGAVQRLRLCGDLDIYAAASLREHILKALEQSHQVELLLEEIAEVDGAGLQVLVAAKAEALRLGVALYLSGHSRAVLDAMQLCRLMPYFGDPILLTRDMTG